MNFDLLGVCFDKTQTCRKGAAKAPLLIRKIFPKLETFISGIDLAEKAFINDLGNIKPKNPESMVRKAALKLKDSKNLPIILGGEHTTSLAGVKSLPRIKSFVCFDAHPDCENARKRSFRQARELRSRLRQNPKDFVRAGNSVSVHSEGHDGIVRNIAKTIGEKNVYLYGVRCRSKEENDFLNKSKINILKNLSVLKKIPAPIYLSIDFDILDPSILPAVGNPEPDGLKFREVMEAVRILAPKLAAVDFVEFTPFGIKKLDEIYAMIAGKIIYGAMAEIVRTKE